ncbi:Alr0841 protein [Candidatus Vecturithrix granuli]|uniref:Alr0841 protein n=1 Tax=Vecturithrix granuli TaxID=1499967 RepID=A0A081C744_VECG1|nr:Alr0841 protein [Candidatus Vecturithrix granuli]
MTTVPKNGLDFLRWLIFEPLLLQRFEERLSKEQQLWWFLWAYSWVALFSCLLWMAWLLTIVLLYAPSLQSSSDLLSHFLLLLQEAFFRLVVGLDLGIIVVGLSVGLFFGLDFGLVLGLIFGLAGGLIFGLVGRGAGLGLGGGIIFSLVLGLGSRLSVGLGSVAAFSVGYFRLIFYPFHLFTSVLNVSFDHNPYRKDGVIWLPLWLADRELLQLAEQQPELALEFAEFLLEYRPLQVKLAARLVHAAAAGTWLQQAFALDADVFVSPVISEEQRKFQPSAAWGTQLEQLRTQLITSQTHTQIGLKKDAFEQFFKLLKEFRSLTLRESRKWNYLYLEAIDKWIESATEELAKLTQKAELLKPIASNFYRAGEALRPETDKPVFVGRDDLKDTLSFEILTARSMPMFLIEGQQRVGKTSLLNFLPDLLGLRFKIVYLDLQGLAERSLSGWLQSLRKAIEKYMPGTSESAGLIAHDNWLQAWEEFKTYLEQISNGKEYKLILAFDEYEILHDDIFQQDPTQARQLLGAMRSFSQHQNQVVFLWVGAHFFSELQNPNWNEFFVQVKHLRVDYLKREDTLKLVQCPTPDFNLIYPDDRRIASLTSRKAIQR